MGMKRFATISFFAAAALAGCAKLGSEAVENTPSEEQAEKTPFIIKVNTPVPTPKPSATKTTFNEETYEVNWSAGDALAVRINSSETPYEFVNETGETNEFTCADFHPEEGVEYEYDILYPYSTDGVYTLAGGVKTPMYGKAIAVGGNQPNVKLQQLSGIIKVTVKNDNAVGTATLTDIKIERMDGGILGGKHTYDRTTGQSEPTDAAVTYTLVGGQSKKVPAGESVAMCLQCAPFTATAGTSLKITYKVNGIEYTETKTFQKDIEFATGKVNKTTVAFAETQCVVEGTAVSGGVQLMTKCLEKDNLYAFRAELSEGDFRIRLTGENGGVYAPASGSDINDGQIAELTENAEGHWTVPAAGVYRVVVDFDDKTVVIYSPETDLKNVTVTYNNTEIGDKNFSQEVTTLWMWGGGLGWDNDPGMKTGFQSKYTLKQSLADPAVFVYLGDAIPRKTNVDANNQTGENKGKDITGHIQFFVSNIQNNVWAYGSSAAAKRNQYSGYVNCELGKTYDSVGGQSDNRYAYHIVPEGANCVIVKIDRNDNTKATVRFEQR